MTRNLVIGESGNRVIDCSIANPITRLPDYPITHAARARDRRRRDDPEGREPRRDHAAHRAAADAGTRSRPGVRSWPSIRSGAGVGEEVFFVRGKEASFPFHPAEPPVDAGIVGIVDHWDLG